MNKNIWIKEKKHIIYLDTNSEYHLNQSWSKWILFIITMKQTNFIKKLVV